VRPVLSRHNSDVSLASRALNEEEGRMHRFGQKFRRDILQDHGGAKEEKEMPLHLQMLRALVEGLGGDEIKSKSPASPLSPPFLYKENIANKS